MLVSPQQSILEAEKVAFKAVDFVSCEKDYVGLVFVIVERIGWIEAIHSLFFIFLV